MFQKNFYTHISIRNILLTHNIISKSIINNKYMLAKKVLTINLYIYSILKIIQCLENCSFIKYTLQTFNDYRFIYNV